MNTFFSGHDSFFVRRRRRQLLSGIVLLVLLLGTGGCDFGNIFRPAVDQIDQAMKEIEATQKAITSESGQWRALLDRLATDLNLLESQATSDTKDILTLATDGVRSTAADTIRLSDAAAQDIIARAGAEARCNGDFVKAGALAQLDYLKRELQFWKQNKHTGAPKPAHAVCAINPSTLSLYPSGSSWLIDTSSMSSGYVGHVFGYNFLGDQMPTLILQNANGQPIREVVVKPAYVTHYQVDLDFANEKFPDVQAGYRIQFKWPDQADPNVISLILRPPAHLIIKNISWDPAQPRAVLDSVFLKAIIENVGGAPSGLVNVRWNNDVRIQDKSPGRPIQPGESVPIAFDGIAFPKCGSRPTNISLSDGSDSRNVAIPVAPYCPTPNIPPPEPERLAFPAYHDSLDRSFSPFGAGDNREYGETCASGFHRSRDPIVSPQVSGPGAGCYFDKWVDENDPHMCRARIRFWVDGASKVNCTIQIYESGDPKPAPPPPPSCSCN